VTPGLEPAGLVLGHAVYVAKVGGEQSHRGRVVSLADDAVVKLDRARWSDEFRVGDRVRAAHAGHFAVNAAVAAAGGGVLRLRLAGVGER